MIWRGWPTGVKLVGLRGAEKWLIVAGFLRRTLWVSAVSLNPHAVVESLNLSRPAASSGTTLAEMELDLPKNTARYMEGRVPSRPAASLGTALAEMELDLPKKHSALYGGPGSIPASGIVGYRAGRDGTRPSKKHNALPGGLGSIPPSYMPGPHRTSSAVATFS